MSFTNIKKTYIPNPANAEHPEIKISLSYQSGRGYSVSVNDVKRENRPGGYGAESCYPMDGKLYRAGECKRRSKDRDAAALLIFDEKVREATERANRANLICGNYEDVKTSPAETTPPPVKTVW